MKLAFREFFHRIGWWGDRGRPLEWSPVLEAVAEGIESGAASIAVLSARRGGKSSAAAVAAAWAAVCSPGSFSLWIAHSGGQVQDIFSQKFVGPLRRHPALRGLAIDVARDRVYFRESGSTVVCVPPAEASIVGRTITGVLLVDECRGVEEEVVDLLRPSVLGTGRTIFIGSAGRPGSWWHRLFSHPEAGDFVREFPTLDAAGNPALCTPAVHADLERERRRAESSGWKAALWRREHLSEWSTLSDHPLCSPEAVERAAVAEIPAFDPRRDEAFISLDLSISRDLTSIAVLAVREGGSMRVMEIWTWDPKTAGRVNYDLVEKKIIALERRYSPRRILADRYQAVALASNLRKQDVRMEELAITPALNQQIFSCLSAALEEGRLTWKRGAHGRLEEEIRSLEIEETQGGFKVLDGGRLHRDESFSVALCAWAASRSRVEPPGRIFGQFEGETRRLPISGARVPVDPSEPFDPWSINEVHGQDWLGPLFLRQVETQEERLFRETREAQERYAEALRRVCPEGQVGR